MFINIFKTVFLTYFKIYDYFTTNVPLYRNLTIHGPFLLKYTYNGTYYNTPISIHREQYVSILSATLTTITDKNVDITEKVHQWAGPFHNFLMNPVRVSNLVPCTKEEFTLLTIMYAMYGEILTRTYTRYHEKVLFHYGLHTPNTRKSLEYLDLSIPV